jgi:hypothetical protein
MRQSGTGGLLEHADSTKAATKQTPRNRLGNAF